MLLQVSNILIRAVWVLYIPQRGPNFLLRSFIAGLLEMLRRVQWNFSAFFLYHNRGPRADTQDLVRVENEHLGNVDQYRITREVPLPYSLEDLIRESENDEDVDDEVASKRSWRSRRRALSMSRKGDRQTEDA